MSNETPYDWQAIRADYESGELSLRQLAAKYGVSKTYLIERRNKENWTKQERPTTDHPQETQGIQKRDVNAATRVATALKLRAQKLTYEEIAQQCGYGSASACYKAIQRELQRVVVENVEELRREEAYMLDMGHRECWELFMDKKNKGRLFAYDRVLETSKDRRKLMGMDVKPEESAGNVVVVREMPPGYLAPVVEAPKP